VRIRRHHVTNWTLLVPVAAVIVLLGTWGRALPTWAAAAIMVLLVGAVLAAVHHAEVVAMKVGEPFGSLVLAVAVTVIEVALIVTLMVSGGPKTSTLARDTVFAAVMITCNGIVGISLLRGALRRRTAVFNAEGAAAAFTSIVTLTTLSLVLPTFTTSAPGQQFSPAQLGFAAVASLVLYGLFVAIQTVRHRDYFLPITTDGTVVETEEHAHRPSLRASVISLVLLLVALVAVVGDAKAVSPTIERGIEAAGYPPSVVGVLIALMVLMPETLTAYRAAGRDRVQTSLNLAYGSAMASIGLTIPTIAVVSTWLSGPLLLGLGSTQIVLFALTVAAGILTIGPGRATTMQGGVHLAILAAFVFLAVHP
jgi:Ca2+:H+ antiporter